MPTTDPDLLDAVEVIKASRSVKGAGYGSKMNALLDRYVSNGWIRYDPSLGSRTYGNSHASFIEITATTFISVNAGFSGDVATTALVMAHEGVHRAIDDHQTIAGELECRTWDANFAQELKAGISYKPKSGGAITVARLTTASALSKEFDKTISEETAQTQIDRILELEIYYKLLKPSWIRTNFANWDGLKNRSDNTLARYLASLASDATGAYADEIIQILEQFALPSRNWPVAKTVLGDLSLLRRALRLVYNAPMAGRRIMEVEKRLNEKFG